MQTRKLIEELLGKGKRIAVPVTDFEKREIALAEIRGTEELELKSSGLLEPKRTALRLLSVKEIGLVVVPGIAFDKVGTRIGTGYGFYDKLLRKISSSVPLVGFCFEENLEKRLPAESHDIKMNIIVTEKQVIRCE